MAGPAPRPAPSVRGPVGVGGGIELDRSGVAEEPVQRDGNQPESETSESLEVGFNQALERERPQVSLLGVAGKQPSGPLENPRC